MHSWLPFKGKFIYTRIWNLDETFCFSLRSQDIIITWGLLRIRWMKDKCMYFPLDLMLNIWPIYEIGLPLNLLDIMYRGKTAQIKVYLNILHECDSKTTSKRNSYW